MISIRTQDRMALVPYDKVIKIYKEEEDCYSVNVGGWPLGHYKTKKRALEVLDEIEQYIIGKIIIPTSYSERVDHLTVGSNLYVEKTNYKIETLPTIYQMPKE